MEATAFVLVVIATDVTTSIKTRITSFFDNLPILLNPFIDLNKLI